MLTRNLTGGLAATALCTGYLVMAYGLRASSLADTVGPAGLPKAIGWAGLGLSLLLCLQSLAEWQRLAPEGRRNRMQDDWRGQGHKLLWAGGLLGLAVAYLLVIHTLGYAVSVGLMILATAIFLGARPGWRVLAIAVGGAVLLWLVFVRLLGVPMPAGLLGGLLG